MRRRGLAPSRHINRKRRCRRAVVSTLGWLGYAYGKRCAIGGEKHGSCTKVLNSSQWLTYRGISRAFRLSGIRQIPQSCFSMPWVLWEKAANACRSTWRIGTIASCRRRQSIARTSAMRVEQARRARSRNSFAGMGLTVWRS